MFRKCLKRDLSAMFRTYRWLAVAVLILCALAVGVTYLEIHLDNNILNTLFFSIIGSLQAWAILGLYGLGIFTVVTILLRVRRSFFSDEAYLTLTTPVPRETIFLSKVVASLILSSVYYLIILLYSAGNALATNGFGGLIGDFAVTDALSAVKFILNTSLSLLTAAAIPVCLCAIPVIFRTMGNGGKFGPLFFLIPSLCFVQFVFMDILFLLIYSLRTEWLDPTTPEPTAPTVPGLFGILLTLMAICLVFAFTAKAYFSAVRRLQTRLNLQ